MTEQWKMQKHSDQNDGMVQNETIELRRDNATDLLKNKEIQRDTILKSFRMCGILKRGQVSTIKVTETVVLFIYNLVQ